MVRVAQNGPSVTHNGPSTAERPMQKWVIAWLIGATATAAAAAGGDYSPPQQAARMLLSAPAAATPSTRPAVSANGVELPVPTAEQAAWQDAELGMFVHFDIEVFDKEYQTTAER